MAYIISATGEEIFTTITIKPIKMESIEYELINKRIELPKIQADYRANDKIYFSIDKTSKGDQVHFFNPEFAFEKQLLVNADINKILAYLKAAEKYPQEYQKFIENGFVFIKTDNANLSLFVMHIIRK